MNISIVCVYNKEEQFQKQLMNSLDKQDIDFEIVPVDNTRGAFSNAAEALNYGAEKANGDILIFSHQDVYLKTSEELRRFANSIAESKIGDVIGAAGVIKESDIQVYNLTMGGGIRQQHSR